jgi:hypothetical protein
MAEFIQVGDDRLQDIFGRLTGKGPDEVSESFFAKHLTPASCLMCIRKELNRNRNKAKLKHQCFNFFIVVLRLICYIFNYAQDNPER